MSKIRQLQSLIFPKIAKFPKKKQKASKFVRNPSHLLIDTAGSRRPPARDAAGAATDAARLLSSAAATIATSSLSVAMGGSTLADNTATALGGGGEGGGSGEVGEVEAANAFNEIRFFKNGRDQGVAFKGVEPGLFCAPVGGWGLKCCRCCLSARETGR